MKHDEFWLITYEYDRANGSTKRITHVLINQHPAEYLANHYEQYPRLNARLIFAMPLTEQRADRLLAAMAATLSR